MESFDFDVAYKVKDMPGVAWHVLGYGTKWTEEDWEFVGDVDDDRENEDNYIYVEPEEYEDKSEVRCVMVGDDSVHVFDIDQLEKLEEDEYCAGCGQIGCGWH